MLKRMTLGGGSIWALVCWLLLSLNTAGLADTLPAGCGTTGGSLYVSPTFAEDRTLFQKSYADGRSMLIRSTDGGLSWAEFSYPDGSDVIYDLYFSPQYARDQTLYATYGGPSGRLERSTDGGESWTTLTTPRTTAITFPVMALYDAATLFLGYGGGQPGGYSEQGLFYSADGGRTWEHRFVGGIAAVALSPNYAQDATLMVSPVAYHADGGIMKSTDRGLTWQPSREGLRWGGDGATDQIIFSPDFAHDRTVFCASWWGLYKSTDGGDHWLNADDTLNPEHGPSEPSLVVSPHYPQDRTLWATWRNPEHGQARSTDSGRTWRHLPTAVWWLSASKTCPVQGACQVVLFGENQNGYLIKSFDGGDTWQCLEEPDALPPTPAPPIEIPEPATWLLLAGGIGLLARYGWRKATRWR